MINKPLKVWLFTLVLAPFLLLLCSWLAYNFSFGAFLIYLPVLLVSFVLSIPAFAVFYFIWYWMERQKYRQPMVSILLLSLGIGLVEIMLPLLDVTYASDLIFIGWQVHLAYIGCFIFFFFLFGMQRMTNHEIADEGIR